MSKDVVDASHEQQRKRISILAKIGARYSVDAGKVLETMKATVFRNATEAQLMALCIVADQYELNPWTKEIYAFPDPKSGGIVPVVGVDGWSRIINRHPEFDGMDIGESSNIVENPEHRPCPEWMECTIYRKDRSHAVVVREYLDECYRKPLISQNTGQLIDGPWQTHTKRMLRWKTIIQASRVAFGYVGIYDPDEADRILEAATIDVKPERPAGKPRTAKPEAIEAPAKDDVAQGGEAAGSGLTAEQARGIAEALDAAGMFPDVLCQHFKVATVPEIPSERFDDAIDWILSQPQ